MILLLSECSNEKVKGSGIYDGVKLTVYIPSYVVHSTEGKCNDKYTCFQAPLTVLISLSGVHLLIGQRQICLWLTSILNQHFRQWMGK